MDRTAFLLKTVAGSILEGEGSFFVIVNADMLDLPLEGIQRLILGGAATPYLKIKDEGIEVSISINRVHYDAFIPWDAVGAVEGEKEAFYCRREDLERKKEKVGIQGGKPHLRLLKD